MILNFAAEERERLNLKLENYLRPVRFRKSRVNPDATDGRTPFDSDFARVALSAPVRRLQNKTQVISLPQYDFVRNRLTHSLEVMCIARGLGLGVEKILSENGLFEIGYISQYHHAITSILETAALVHDIGNPPFGHKIEKAVQKYFQKITDPYIKVHFDALANDAQREDFLNIEGNTQGFRVLRHLALAKDEFSFNLTMPTMATIVKYPFSSTEGNKDPEKGYSHEQEKFGYFQAEAEDYYKICDKLCLRRDGQRHPLTYLLEAADDIAYSLCDIEDAFKDGKIDIPRIIDCFNKCGYDDAVLKMKIDNLANDDEVLEQANIQDLRISIQSTMIVECTKVFCEHYKDIIDGNFKGELMACSNVSNLKECCEDIVRPVFDDPEILENEQKAADAAYFLLDGFLKAILMLMPDTPIDTPEYLLYSYISPNYRKVACEDGFDIPTNLYKKFLLVTDYIFGMTDRFLLNLAGDEDVKNLINAVNSKLANRSE